MRLPPMLIAAPLIAGIGSGCYTTWDIAPREVRSLEGFHKGETREIATYDGEIAPFTKDSELIFHGNDGLEATARFRRIRVKGMTFAAVELEYGAYISVDLSRMTSVQMRNFSVGKTVGLSVGLGAGLPLAALTAYVIYALSQAGIQ